MDEKIDESALRRVDFESMWREWDEGVQTGKSSRIAALDEVYKWMPGTINALYGWANDGKGTFYDYLAVVDAMFDKNSKHCMMKQEDISSTRFKNESPKLTFNRVHRGLIWTYTGKCPIKSFAKKNGATLITKEEFNAALQWVDEQFYIFSPKDRSLSNVLLLMEFYWNEYGITHFCIDPWKSVRVTGGAGVRGDYVMDEALMMLKEFAIRTNTSVNLIHHPKSLTDVKVSKDINAPFKIVNQYMVVDGPAFDKNMDGQFSIYRTNRHNNPRDPSAQFHNLKQRNGEEVEAEKGSYTDIKFHRNKRRFYFGGRCPITGDTWTEVQYMKQALIDYSEPTKAEPIDPNELPF